MRLEQFNGKYDFILYPGKTIKIGKRSKQIYPYIAVNPKGLKRTDCEPRSYGVQGTPAFLQFKHLKILDRVVIEYIMHPVCLG